MEERKLIVPGIYRHFKHTEDGGLNNYTYAVVGVAETIDESRLKLENINEGHGFLAVETEYNISVKVLIGKDDKLYIPQRNWIIHEGKYVIYKSMYNGEVWARPYDMFMSEVDHEKYSKITQKYRFEYAGGIQLKNIDLSNVSTRKQYLKSGEEESKYHEALHLYLNNEDTKEHVIEKLFDFIQAELGILEKRGIKADDIMKYYNTKYIDKLDKEGRK